MKPRHWKTLLNSLSLHPSVLRVTRTSSPRGTRMPCTFGMQYIKARYQLRLGLYCVCDAFSGLHRTITLAWQARTLVIFTARNTDAIVGLNTSCVMKKLHEEQQQIFFFSFFIMMVILALFVYADFWELSRLSAPLLKYFASGLT
jgi:hypothetical protein